MGGFQGKVYKTPEQVAKEMKGYKHWGADMQKIAAKSIDLPFFNSADEYYRIALNGVKDVGTTNYACKLHELPNAKLINFVQQKYGVSGGVNVVIPNETAEIRTEILSSKYFWDALKNNADKIAKNPNEDNTFSVVFENTKNKVDKDLFATLHKAEIYAPYYDVNGNIHLILVDYYDFAKTKADIISEVIINNAYVQQELGELTNYVIIIPMILML